MLGVTIALTSSCRSIECHCPRRFRTFVQRTGGHRHRHHPAAAQERLHLQVRSVSIGCPWSYLVRQQQFALLVTDWQCSGKSWEIRLVVQPWTRGNVSDTVTHKCEVLNATLICLATPQHIPRPRARAEQGRAGAQHHGGAVRKEDRHLPWPGRLHAHVLRRVGPGEQQPCVRCLLSSPYSMTPLKHSSVHQADQLASGAGLH